MAADDLEIIVKLSLKSTNYVTTWTTNDIGLQLLNKSWLVRNENKMQAMIVPYLSERTIEYMVSLSLKRH